MAEQSTLPAVTVVPLRIGGQELMLPDKAQEFLVKKTAKGWEIQESAELGNNSVFVKRDGAGVVRLIYKQVPLAVAKKEVVGIKGSMTITIGGYNRCNQIAGLHIVTPPSITVDGVEQGNPAVIRNEKGEKVRVVARKIIIGYSPNGNLVAIDSVRHYDFEAYYLQDLHAKTAIPDAARFGTSVLCPFDPEAEILEKGSTIYARKAGKIWVFKAIKDIEGIWMDMAHKEIAEVYSQHIQHQKFGEVIAQSLATRNGLKAHPAISAQQVIVQNGVAKVLVYGYRHDTTAQEFEEMGKQIVAGEQPEGAQVIHDEGVANFE
jgi:hypothetical protein